MPHARKTAEKPVEQKKKKKKQLNYHNEREMLKADVQVHVYLIKSIISILFPGQLSCDTM